MRIQELELQDENFKKDNDFLRENLSEKIM
jgi:hypothetical protein